MALQQPASIHSARAERITRQRHAALVVPLLGALLVMGCATGRSVKETVSGWFHRDGAQTPAASTPPAKAPAKRKAQAPATEAAPPAPEAAAPGAASEPPAEAGPSAPPEEPREPEPSIFDPY